MFEELLYAGIYAINEYVALHVVSCLIPAFLLAGAMTTFISRDFVIRYMGFEAKKSVAFPLAAISGIFLAVCSCTVIPIAAGIYRRGGSIGPAFILLWTAPATNLLALIYTGAVLGVDMAAVRAAAAVSTAFIVGLVMMYAFKSEEQARIGSVVNPDVQQGRIMGREDIVILILLLMTLLLPNYLGAGRPYLDKVAIFAAALGVTLVYVYTKKETAVIREWLHETWWFVRLIFPLLIVGVFLVGIIGAILPEEWITAYLGGSGIYPTFLASLIGAVSYFATLTEAPFVHTLMELGMGKGPALALLLAGPGLSLPNMVVITRVFGPRKAAVYIITTVILATAAGFVVGNTIWK
jgi:uncharacterized membrane protein YraQ (UPF0718 family)